MTQLVSFGSTRSNDTIVSLAPTDLSHTTVSFGLTGLNNTAVALRFLVVQRTISRLCFGKMWQKTANPFAET